jgi:hypothetical protein
MAVNYHRLNQVARRVKQSLLYSNILSRCQKEEDIEDNEQPLYIDLELDLIKCGWCHHFKGSTEPRVVNQHVKTAKCHLLERQRHLRPDDLYTSSTGRCA